MCPMMDEVLKILGHGFTGFITTALVKTLNTWSIHSTLKLGLNLKPELQICLTLFQIRITKHFWIKETDSIISLINLLPNLVVVQLVYDWVKFVFKARPNGPN